MKQFQGLFDFNRWLFLASLFLQLFLSSIWSIDFRDYKMECGRGIIKDVTLVNDFNQPYTEVHIIFKTKKIIWNMSAASRSGIMEITKKNRTRVREYASK